jgi:hypothetical protein
VWIYNPSLTTDRDKVRFLIGDTDENEPLLQDEEIDFLLSENTDIYLAASSAAESISAKFARQSDKSIGDAHTTYSQKAEAYHRLAERLKSHHLTYPFFIEPEDEI